jgi:hypothetical protein
MIGTCSATLVQPNLIVTAAHCLDAGPSEAWFGAQRVAITYCEAHPDYERVLGADIAFCTLASSGPPPARLSSCEDPRAVTLVGYGYTDAQERGTRAERAVRVRVRDVRAEGRELVVGDDDHGACHGDSGGSAFDERAALVGVISRRGPALDTEYVEDCGSTTIVTALAPHLAWLESASGVTLSASCPAAAAGCALAKQPTATLAIVLFLLALRRKSANTLRVRV